MVGRVALIAAFCSGLFGCGVDRPPQPPAFDAGSGPSDAGFKADAGAADAGFDAGLPDAGAPDAGQPHPVGCVGSVAAGHHSFSCSAVTYEVEIPAACTAGGCGAIVDIHGATMTASAQDKSTRLRTIGKNAGFVVVQPTAPVTLIGRSWTPSTDDPKVWKFVQELTQALVLDPKRLHFTGFSQGGAMTWRMLCAHADAIASAAPIAAADGSLQPSVGPFTLDCPFDGAQKPSRPVPILQMHGTTDGLVPIAKGLQQRDAVVAAWGLGAPSVVSMDSKHTRTRFTHAQGAVLEFLQHGYETPPPLILVPLKGHCVPGGDDLPANGTLGQTMFFSCNPPNAFDWGQVVLQFFIDHPAP